MRRLYASTPSVKKSSQFFYSVLISLFACTEIKSQVIYPSAPVGAQPDSVITLGITPGSFSSTAADNIVYFGGVKAAVLAATPSQLTVTVPYGSFYSPISVTTNGASWYSWAPFVTFFTNNDVPTLSLNSFAVKVDSATGTGPAGITSGDFDGDGKADIAVANTSANTISIVQNTGSLGIISFATRIDIATGAGPNHVVPADIDGDGKLDMVVVNSSANTVSVFINTTTGAAITFAPKVDFVTGNTPYKCTVNDFDVDGKPDIAVVNRSGDNTVSVLRNTRTAIGQLSFAAKVDYPTGNFPIDITSDDMNQDGKPELAVVNYFSNTLSIFKNTSAPGAVSFQPKQDYTTGSFPVSVSSGYILRNFRRDIAVANFTDNTVSVFTHTDLISEPTFNAKIDFATGTGPGSLTLNDVDGDGFTDILTANQNTNSVSILRNTSNPNIALAAFAEKSDYNAGSLPTGVFTADFDNDGKPDIATSNFTGNNLSVLRNKAGDSALSNRSITVCPNSTATIAAGISGTSFTWQMSTDGINFFDISQTDMGFSGSRTAVLTIRVAYTFFYGWQFRCLVNGLTDRPVALKLAVSWTGAADNLWENSGNWNCGVIPDGNTDVFVTNSSVVINSNAQCRSIKVSPGIEVTVNNGFNLQVTH